MKGDTRYGESVLAGKEPSACVPALHLCLAGLGAGQTVALLFERHEQF